MRYLQVLLLLGLPGLVMAQVLPPTCATGAPNPVTWYLTGVRFSDGATASGSLSMMQITTPIPLSTSPPPAALLCGRRYAGFLDGLTPCPSTNQLPVVNQAGLLNYSGMRTLRLQVSTGSFVGGSGTLPLSANFSAEGTCGNAICSDPSLSNTRFVVAGSISATPPTPPPTVPVMNPAASIVLTNGRFGGSRRYPAPPGSARVALSAAILGLWA